MNTLHEKLCCELMRCEELQEQYRCTNKVFIKAQINHAIQVGKKALDVDEYDDMLEAVRLLKKCL